MTPEYRYLGPDGEGIAELPDGVGAALGSEYCVHLLPSAVRMAEAVREATTRRAPLLLLTPYFRDAELKSALPLFRAISAGAPVDVAVNDWGALQTLRGLFPGVRLSIGRLLAGQKRCPRIGVSVRLTEEGRLWHGEGIFSSSRARTYLAEAYGVTRYHVDDLPWNPPTAMDGLVPGQAGMPRGVSSRPTAMDGLVPEQAGMPRVASSRPAFGDPPFLFVHVPHAIVTVSDACAWIGGASSASVASCPRPCRNGHVLLREPSMGGDLLLKGKARFAKRDPGETGRPLPPFAAAVVTYTDLP